MRLQFIVARIVQIVVTFIVVYGFIYLVVFLARAAYRFLLEG